MTTYIAGNWKALRYIYSKLLELLLIILFFWLYCLILSKGSFPIFFSIAATLYFIIRMAWEDRIKQLAFDHEKKEAIVVFNHFGGRKTERLSFDELRIKVYRKKTRSIRFLAAPLSISIHQGIRTYADFELNQIKDGFSIESLEEIVVHFKSLSIPVTEKFI